jgi:hypothetical protein
MSSVQLSNASVELSNLASASFQAARQAQDTGSFLRFVCLHLHGKWLFYRSGWLIGRSMRLTERAQEKLKTSTAILDSLGVRRDAEQGAAGNSRRAE